MSKVFSRQELFFLQDESTYGTIPNSSGTATVAAADACRAIQMTMERVTDPIFRRDKTGSRTAQSGIAGRKIGSWSMNQSLVTSGVVGTLPDCDTILKSLFGAAAVAKSGTVAITGATNATPIVITATTHGLTSFDVVTITGVGGNTNANGVWAVSVVDANTFQLIGSAGNAAYTSGGTVDKAALVYSPVDAELSFDAWSFRKPAAAVQRVALGIVATEATFNLGEDIATWQSRGPCKWVLDSKNFANATADEKGGLTAFPVEPTSPVTAGAGIAGFKGRAVLNSGEITRIRTAQMVFGSGLDLPRDTFNKGYVDTPEADERTINTQFNMYEDDSAGQAALEQAAIDKTGVDMVFNIGVTAGNIYVAVLRSVQLASPTRDDGQRAFTVAYPNSRAYGSALTALNEMRLWLL